MCPCHTLAHLEFLTIEGSRLDLMSDIFDRRVVAWVPLLWRNFIRDGSYSPHRMCAGTAHRTVVVADAGETIRPSDPLLRRAVSCCR
jgi:hypothetical protein